MIDCNWRCARGTSGSPEQPRLRRCPTIRGDGSWRAALAGILTVLGLGSFTSCTTGRAPNDSTSQVPEFAVTTARGSFYYSAYTLVDGAYVAEDSHARGVVSGQDGGRWTLTLTAKEPIRSFHFPWQSARQPLDDRINDDVFVYPHVLGVSEPARDRNHDWFWWGLPYPGGAFAPLVVMADADQAAIVAAANWPPKAVTPLYAAQRMTLKYADEPIPAGGTTTVGAIVGSVSGPGAWRGALDLYRSWLETVMPPVTYPDWMWKGEGLLNVQLENIERYAPDALPQPSPTFPWVQFWGQMTAYAGGCCELKPALSARYADTLPAWSRAAIARGYHVGYYSAPYYEDLESQALDRPAGAAWLRDWLSTNRTAGANAFYVDVIGRSVAGPPALVRSLFTEGAIAADTLIEGAVDIYPVAGLVSGALVGDASLCGAPYKPATTKTTFPRFGRYLLRDRLIYLGGSNTDWRFWGTDGRWADAGDAGGINADCDYASYCATISGLCAYGTERLAFLLGAKLDLLAGSENAITAAIVSERQRVRWWERRPAYQDTEGLDLAHLNPADHIEVSRFDDADGHVLLAVSNPLSRSGQRITCLGMPVTLPAQPIAVIEIPRTASP